MGQAADVADDVAVADDADVVAESPVYAETGVAPTDRGVQEE